MAPILFFWEFIGPHHKARISASAIRDPSFHARAFALSNKSEIYDFYEERDIGCEVTVAYRAVQVEKLTFWKRLIAMARHIWCAADDVYFLCHYQRPEVFLTALFLRLRLKRVFVMTDSKFDDYQRWIWRELGKSLLYIPYSGALVSGTKSASYLRFLGMRGPIETGYDTIDVASLLRTARFRPQPDISSPYFVIVARLIERKNVQLAIRAFRTVLQQVGDSMTLAVVGVGPEEEVLRALVRELDLNDRVRFLGKISNEKIPSLIAGAMALLLVSKSEQWGLVINEAVACNVPVIVSDAVGAREALVRNFINGFVIESDNERGLASAMVEIIRNRERFRTSQAAIEACGVERFADAVFSLVSG